MKNVAKALVKEGIGANVSNYYVGGSKGLFTGSDVADITRYLEHFFANINRFCFQWVLQMSKVMVRQIDNLDLLQRPERT